MRLPMPMVTFPTLSKYMCGMLPSEGTRRVLIAAKGGAMGQPGYFGLHGLFNTTRGLQ